MGNNIVAGEINWSPVMATCDSCKDMGKWGMSQVLLVCDLGQMHEKVLMFGVFCRPYPWGAILFRRSVGEATQEYANGLVHGS